MTALTIEEAVKLALPCPFCGQKPEHLTVIQFDGRETYELQCMSEICLVNPVTMTYDTPDETLEAWNLREDSFRVEKE